MALPLYLAMTAEEMACTDPLPALGAAMTCHFSLYGKGLEGLPLGLPTGWMVVLNDRVPIWNHDPELVAGQLSELSPKAVLLDFQQTSTTKSARFLQALVEALPCPAAVSSGWCGSLDCPVFLEPVPPSRSLQNYLASWEGREIWLDVSAWGEKITVTTEGSTISSLPSIPTEAPCHREEKLLCHYRTEVFADRAEFSLFRTSADMNVLLVEAEALGVTRAVGLWNELKDLWA